MLRRIQPSITPTAGVQPAWLQFAPSNAPSSTESQFNAPAAKRCKDRSESEADISTTAASAPEPAGYEAISTPENWQLDTETLDRMVASLRGMSIEQSDTSLSFHIYDLAEDYPEGLRSEQSRAFVVAADIIAYVRQQLHHGSANQRWNQRGSGQPQNDELANGSTAPIDEALMRTHFIDHYVGGCLPDSEFVRFAFSETHATEDRRDLARRIAHALLGEDSHQPGDAQRTSAQAANARPDFAALGQELLHYKPRLRAHAAFAVAAGNDDHMAAVAYTEARRRLDSRYVVQLMQMPGHTYCRIGMPAWPQAHWWVIDPWPRDANPVRFEHHLGCDNSQVVLSKPAKGMPCTAEKGERYREWCELVAHRLTEFQAFMWPGIDIPMQATHHCLYPTKDPIRPVYTVLIRQPDVELTPQYHRISRELEDARIIVAGIIRDVKASFKYGSTNQRWNFERNGQPGSSEAADRSQERYVEASLRGSYLRYVYPRHVSDDEMRRFAEADHRGDPYRIDLAHQIQRLLASEPTESGAAPAHTPNAQASLDMLRERVLECKRRLSTFAALGAEVGNCGEFANLSYMLARQRFGPEYRVAYAWTVIPDHAFCVVGKAQWPVEHWWVIDAWPRDAYPVLAQHYFGYENGRLGVAKPGKGGAHSFEQRMRYARLRGDVANKYSEYRHSDAGTRDASYVRPLADDTSMYNCLYPTTDPVKWRYYVSAAEYG